MTVLSFSAVAAPQIVAHRGGSGERDENTLVALKDCYNKKIFAYEIDIHITSDDKLVVCHDGNLHRTCGEDLVIEEHTLEEVLKVKTKKGNKLSTLDEVLEFFAPKENIFLQVEIKDPRNEIRLKKLVELAVANFEARKFLDKRLLVISFSFEALKEIKAKKPEIATGFLVGGTDEKNITRAQSIDCEWVSVELASTSWRFLSKAKKAGLKIALWTIRSDEGFNLARAFLPDAIVTDYPLKYQNVLEGEKK